MAFGIPLDDEIGRTFYIDGAPWRLVYNRGIRYFALQRVAPAIDLDRALELIASGELLWNPPEQFDALRSDASVEDVRQHVALLDAFRRSPVCADSTDWALLARIDMRLADARSWLARRALTSGDAGEVGGGAG